MTTRVDDREPRGRLAEIAYRDVKRRILEGEYQPGSRLRIETLVSELGVSRHPVMEAMKRLSGEGFVAILPQVGCEVERPDVRDVADFFKMFAFAEGESAELAARRRSTIELTTLNELSGRIGALLTSGFTQHERAERYRALNARLHHEIRRMARSRLLRQIADGFWDRADFYVTSLLGVDVFAERLAVAHAEHESIIAAIERGDADTARSQMASHVSAFGNLPDRLVTVKM